MEDSEISPVAAFVLRQVGDGLDVDARLPKVRLSVVRTPYPWKATAEVLKALTTQLELAKMEDPPRIVHLHCVQGTTMEANALSEALGGNCEIVTKGWYGKDTSKPWLKTPPILLRALDDYAANRTGRDPFSGIHCVVLDANCGHNSKGIWMMTRLLGALRLRLQGDVNNNDDFQVHIVAVGSYPLPLVRLYEAFYLPVYDIESTHTVPGAPNLDDREVIKTPFDPTQDIPEETVAAAKEVLSRGHNVVVFDADIGARLLGSVGTENARILMFSPMLCCQVRRWHLNWLLLSMQRAFPTPKMIEGFRVDDVQTNYHYLRDLVRINGDLYCHTQRLIGQLPDLLLGPPDLTHTRRKKAILADYATRLLKMRCLKFKDESEGTNVLELMHKVFDDDSTSYRACAVIAQFTENGYMGAELKSLAIRLAVMHHRSGWVTIGEDFYQRSRQQAPLVSGSPRVDQAAQRLAGRGHIWTPLVLWHWPRLGPATRPPGVTFHANVCETVEKQIEAAYSHAGLKASSASWRTEHFLELALDNIDKLDLVFAQQWMFDLVFVRKDESGTANRVHSVTGAVPIALDDKTTVHDPIRAGLTVGASAAWCGFTSYFSQTTAGITAHGVSGITPDVFRRLLADEDRRVGTTKSDIQLTFQHGCKGLQRAEYAASRGRGQ
ncbi:hypothetical protein QBC34DRAFT_493238 [Podospora aff. communis PSN243]|uniref:Uncharacterized protein n=1 Tax=Podospora aff. communis PSN243 TaxID=3040156 RepID=A0AAV9GSY8_9PEZI|nr:hypothetical protein QBC34DRAFT_493238 [Podospora aff. communis PSN243]